MKERGENRRKEGRTGGRGGRGEGKGGEQEEEEEEEEVEEPGKTRKKDGGIFLFTNSILSLSLPKVCNFAHFLEHFQALYIMKF